MRVISPVSAFVSADSVYYRLKTKALYPAPVEDLARAVREVLAKADEYHIDPKRYSIWGGSAGAHLAAAFGTKNMGYPLYRLPKPAALVLAYPVISMTKELGHKQSHDFFVGKDATPEQEAFASIEQHVDADYPATYIWCSDDDNVVNPDNICELIPANLLIQRSFYDSCPLIIGMAKGKKEAIDLVKKIVEGMVRKKKGFDVKEYIKNR